MWGPEASYNTRTKDFQVKESKAILSEKQEEEPIEETIVEYVCVTDDSEDPEKDPEEEPEEEELEEDEEVDPEEYPEEESSGEPDEGSAEESKVSSQTDIDGNDHQSGSNQYHSQEKKRPLDATASDSEGETGEGTETSKRRCSRWDSQPEQDESASKSLEHTGSSGKRRRSRWDSQPEKDGETGEGNEPSKRRKTRWASDVSQLKMLGPIQLPDFVKGFVESESDPEIQKLKVRLSGLNSKLLSPELHDDRPEKDRSPSPEPVYNNLGIRINTREARLREKLVKERRRVISKLIKKNPTFKPPPDYRPQKLFKKLYVPVKEYPTYNFIGIIIGPRGNTQKRLEKETGAKILLRGKGSMKIPNKPDPSDCDDLHVLIEADNQCSLNAAVQMVEKLLIPIDEGKNEHKRAQLEELAMLKGTYGDGNICGLCKEVGHRQYACPHQQSTFKMVVTCEKCGSFCHFTPSCPLLASPQLGNSLSGSSGLGGGSNPNSNTKPKPKPNDSSLYVGYLPQSVDENRMRELFCPFGKIADVKVIKDRSTGLSKGYGFVNFESSSDAAMAVTHMNGHKMEGKMLAVRVAGRPPAGAVSVMSHLPMYPGPLAAVPANGPSLTAWPGPPGSMLPEAQSSYPKNEGLGWPSSSLSSVHGNRLPESKATNIFPSVVSSQAGSKLVSSFDSFCRYPNQVPFSSLGLASQFPGDPDYCGSQLPSYSAVSTLKPSLPFIFSQTPDSSSYPSWPTSQLP